MTENNDHVPELTNGQFNDFTKQGIALIDFYAEWCMPCLMMAAVVDELSERFKGRAKIGKVNIEDNPELCKKFNVSSIPHFIIFKDGVRIDEFIGSISAEELEAKLNKHL